MKGKMGGKMGEKMGEKMGGGRMRRNKTADNK